jgi:glycosyltransferase involved in cell wall biosynthesis
LNAPGYDRVIEGIAQYNQRGGVKPVFFDIIGSGHEKQRLMADTLRLGLSHQVRFFGSLSGNELTQAMAACHIGISSIGMHRIKVDTSNLKSREFCARGLPFVIAYADRDFQTELPFVFHAPATDEPLDIAALVRFFDELRLSRPSYPAEMRAFALERLTWQVKMAPVCEVIRQSIGDKSLQKV